MCVPYLGESNCAPFCMPLADQLEHRNFLDVIENSWLNRFIGRGKVGIEGNLRKTEKENNYYWTGKFRNNVIKIFCCVFALELSVSWAFTVYCVKKHLGIELQLSGLLADFGNDKRSVVVGSFTRDKHNRRGINTLMFKIVESWMGRNYRKNDVSLTFERRKTCFDWELGVDNLPADNWSLDHISNFLISLQPSSLGKAFIAGALSGTCSTLLFQPFDLVKTRLQVDKTALPPAGRLKIG